MKHYGKHLVKHGYKLAGLAAAKFGGKPSTWKVRTKAPRGLKRRNKKRKGKKSPKFAADDLHSGTSETKGKFVVFKHLKEKIEPKSMVDYSYTFDSRLTSVVGTQATLAISAIGTISQWQTSTALGTGITGITSNVRYFDFNPSLQNTGSTFIAASGITQNDKLCLYSSENIFDFVNLSSASTFIRFTAYKCVRETIANPDQYWGNLLSQQSMGKANAAVPAITVGTGTAAGTMVTSMPYTNPHDLPDFKTYWKPIYQTAFEMGPAATRKLMVHGLHQDVATETDIVNSPAGVYYRVGTVFFHAIAVGQPVYDAGTAPTSITYHGPDIGILQHTKLRFKSVKSGPQRIKASYAQFGTSANTAVANAELINIVDALVQVARA